MPTVVQFRRGTTAQNDAFTGAVGEISVDTQKDTLRVHDGSTAGGFEILSANATQTITNKTPNQHWIPATDSAYDLGSASFKWRDLYLSGNTIYIGDATISAAGTSVVLPAGSTISGAGSLLDSALARQAFSVTDAGGDGSMTYNAGTGVFTYTGPSATEVRAHFSGGTGVDISSGVVSIGQSVATTANVTFGTVETTGNVTVGGNLTVNGTTTTINSTTLDVDDLNITVASGAADASAANGAGLTVDGANATITYVSATDTWDFNKAFGTGTNVISNYTTTQLTEGSNLYYTTARFDTRLATKTTGDLAEGSNLYYTTARADSDFDVRLSTKTTTDVAEGSNLYYTTARADSDAKAAITGGTGITYSAGTIETNDAQIVHDNLSGFVATEHVDHSTVTMTAGNGLTGGGDLTASRTFNIGEGTGITVGADTISTNDAEIVHDNLSGYVADEHVAHTSVSVIAGAGLTGGGTIAASRTLNIGQGTGITVAADTISTNDAQIVHDNLSGFVSDEHVAHSGVTLTAGVGLNGGGNIAASRTFNIDSAELYANFAHDDFHDYSANEHIDHTSVSVIAGAGLTGGGTIAASRTLNIGAGTGITVGADAISTNDAQIVHDNLSGFVADEHIAHSGVTITAGNGLTGGGTIAASRTLNVGAGTGVTVTADAVSIGQDVGTTANVTFGTVTTTGNVTIGGDLQVQGTTTTINSENYSVTDNMIYMNAGESSGSPTLSVDVGWAANVNDGGSYTHVGMFRDATDDRFKVFGAYTPEPDAALEINTGHASFALADFQAATFHGALSGNASTATALETARTIGLTGDVTATGVSFDGTGNITLTTAMAANSVDLTTHTTGNYVASITNGSYITGANGGSEGAALTLAVDATSANTASKVVARDASGNFSAGTITAALSGNATTATTLQTARNINGVSFNGSANITVEPYVEDDAGTNATRYLTFVDNSTAGYKRLNEDANLSYNPSTNTLTTTTFAGALSGNATTASAWATGRTITLTGDVTGVSGAFDGSGNLSFSTSIAANTITSTELSGATSLVIYNSAGTALKTLYGAGS